MELPPYFPDTPKVRQAMARMYTNIETADGILGELLEQLEEDGLLENTVVFHWSDHGPMPRGKRWPYDSGIHIPMIVRWPGKIDPGTISDRLVSTIDLAPTVMSICGIDIPRHIQGKAFLGNAEDSEREYVFATRDRYDEAYDMIRAVRDKRYKYIRHYRPELPYLIWVPYRNKHPIMEEMWRLNLEDGLEEGPQKLMFRKSRPAEELYDTENDPWEINNLASDPAHKENLERLRKALDEWIDEVGDMGEIPETEMLRQWYPDGKQPDTAYPRFILFSGDECGQIPVDGKMDAKAPAAIDLHCPTQGASIAYRIDANGAHWKLYAGPISLEPGKHTVCAKAIRIGYRESDEVRLDITVR